MLLVLALARLLVHTLTNGQYGFHRDELATLDDARYLAWGYVAYPPLTPLVARVAVTLFGTSLVGVRFFAALAQSLAMVLTGLMAHELGGSRRAQIAAALAVAIAPFSLIQGAMLQYVSFDYLWWVVVAYFTIRLLKSEDGRWWVGIGAAIGLGMLTKYTMAVFAVGLVLAVVLTRARRYLATPWPWAGAAVALLIWLPNLLWQVEHTFVSLDFLRAIHARDVHIGRTDGYVIEQIIVCANLFTLPLWGAGLYFYVVAPAGARYRMLGWMYLIPFVLLLAMQGRSYYLAPAYPMLLAAGVVAWEGWLGRVPIRHARVAWGTIWGALTLGGVVFSVVMLPIAPINSGVWHLASRAHDNFVEQIGWPELVATVADIYAGLPADERAQTGILVSNYGEAGAINLYGLAYGLPRAISGVNSYWLRGYGQPPPATVIVVGYTRDDVGRWFEACRLAGQITNCYDVVNEEYRQAVFVCQRPRLPWPALWERLKHWG